MNQGMNLDTAADAAEQNEPGPGQLSGAAAVLTGLVGACILIRTRLRGTPRRRS